MRNILLALVACVLAGCGGGGGSGPGTGTATLSGQVATRNGTTADLAGIDLVLVSTGEVATTDVTGSFAFGSVPAQTLTLRVQDPVALHAVRIEVEHEDEDDANDEDPDDDGDDHDVGDDDCDVEDVRAGESVEVVLSVDGGVITTCDWSRGDAAEREADVRLHAAPSSDDPDAAGEAETESRDDRQRLKVEVEHLAPGREVRALVVCDGVPGDLGVRTVDALGEAEWEVATNDGGVLPNGAATVEDLAGCDVEVRDASTGTVLLVGTLSSLPAPVGDDDGDGDDDHDDGERFRGRSILTPSGGVPGEAFVEIRRRTDEGGRNELRVEVRGQAPGLQLQVRVADAPGGALASVGTFTVGPHGEGELELDSEDGDAMPFGVSDVGLLSGRAAEVRDAGTAAVLFSGAVPALVPED